MELRICDLRNAKFQGYTVNKQPSGFGFVLDQNYSFIAGQINNGTFVGPLAVVYGDSTKLYTENINANPHPFFVYNDKNYKIYRLSKSKAIIDISVNKILLKLQLSQKFLQAARGKSSDLRNLDNSLKVLDQRKYNDQSYLRILCQFLQVKSIQSSNLSYQNFIKEKFKSKHKGLINIYETSKQFGLSFRQQGLFLKLSKKPDCIINVGFDTQKKKLQIGRRYTYFRDHTNSLIEEVIQTEPISCIQFQTSDKMHKNQNNVRMAVQSLNVKSPRYKTQQSNRSFKVSQKQLQNQQLFQKGRPKECIRNLRQYYKRSLTFINKYLSLNFIYNLKSQFQFIYQQTLQLQNGNYAQVQLQNNGYQVNQYNQPIITKQNQYMPNQATLVDLKRQLDWAKGIGKRTRTPVNKQQWPISDRSELDKPNRFNYSPQKYKFQDREKYQSPIRQIDPNLQRNNPKINKFNPEVWDQNQRSKSRRQLKYLDSQNDEPTESILRNSRNVINKNEDKNLMGQNRVQYPYKFKYMDEQQNKMVDQRGRTKYDNPYTAKTPTKSYNYSGNSWNNTKYAEVTGVNRQKTISRSKNTRNNLYNY